MNLITSLLARDLRVAFWRTVYVQSGDEARVSRVVRRLRAGTIQINGRGPDYGSPFGGYKQSGNGREGGLFGLEDYLEVKVRPPFSL